MAMMPRMELRQGQSLVMTPQLLQAIKLLQLSHLELRNFVEGELERNPLLEREEAADPPARPDETQEPLAADPESFSRAESLNTQEGMEGRLGTGLDNVFQSEQPAPARSEAAGADSLPIVGGAYGAAGGSFDGDPEGFEMSLTAELSLHDHLVAQLDLAVADPAERIIGRHIIDAVDEGGYLSEPLAEIALRLGIALGRVEAMLGVVQGFDPSGVAARDLAECLAIQLRDRDRFDPAMQALVANLPLVARRDVAALKRLCGVDEEDIAEMVAEIRRLDPKPGRAFGGAAAETVVPDVFIRAAPDGSWLIDLNPDTLPRLLVNQTYHARVSRAVRNEAEKAFIAECLQNANWLTRSLEQRARTILKVASEIVRQQDGFFAHGVEHLRPLNLKTVADAIGMHESTVSRVTSNKYLTCSRGVFEMKYFFSAAIAATGHGEAHSAEAVRFRIRQMIEEENPAAVLSDDAIVTRLKAGGIDIARRTVAKYRESLRIPSSMERRREKAAPALGGR
ncbi:RNA polymerase factor sigma-54 [Bosea sp. (in: a-proteobacteria)]|uniref:RNA polymerase factor sigma-54 n=1 Tax=Bosea sp. (in: a-proteobacteria) TaxID=1871050 RepID=UPI002625BFB5|nr:RNA polymerase factor sigma-54 [Bosea sp. (in: a-proteobacteria)]MCO5091629.1 RNA polymerase factor sigma-54 [Bosea sp. (in: a-proteobacteria)]